MCNLNTAHLTLLFQDENGDIYIVDNNLFDPMYIDDGYLEFYVSDRFLNRGENDIPARDGTIYKCTMNGFYSNGKMHKVIDKMRLCRLH